MHPKLAWLSPGKSMAKIINMAVFALYILVSLDMLKASIKQPHYNWDMIMYIAIAKSYEEPDMKKLHSFTYSEVKKAVSDQVFTSLTQGYYRHDIYTDLTAFKEQLHFYRVRPLYSALIYLFYKCGMGIAFATHFISGLSIALGIILLYLILYPIVPSILSLPILALCYFFPFSGVAGLSTPDGLAFLVILLSVFFYFKNRTLDLLIFAPIMIFARSELILFVVPLLMSILITKPSLRRITFLSISVCILSYIALAYLTKYPGWATILHHTFVQSLTHPISKPPSLEIQHYINILLYGFKDIPNNKSFFFYLIISAYSMAMIYYISRIKSIRDALYYPGALLAIVCSLYVASRFILFPLTWDRFFLGPYMIMPVSLLVMIIEFLKNRRSHNTDMIL